MPKRNNSVPQENGHVLKHKSTRWMGLMFVKYKLKKVKDFQQFRAKARAGAGAVVFKVEAWSRSRSKMERLRNTGTR